MFRKVLIANRGEIAVRIIRSLREMNITSVAAFSDADRDALFVQAADESYRLGPAPAGESYLSVRALLEVAAQAHVDAVHPGYGFLAENAEFARAVQGAGLTFIGPSEQALRTMGNKVAARGSVGSLGVPLVPGSDGTIESLEEARAVGDEIGYPLAVKAAGGGGGRGIRVVWKREELAEALESSSREAAAYFGNADVYLERYFPNPRHVEVQVLGDLHGNLVHLGERDCSVQRRHQKLIEESPSPAVGTELRNRMGDAALRAARSVDYSSAGTVEFLLTPEGDFYFLEMNTRIQVEHPVTEWVTGVDLIREMVLAAAGESISVRQSFERLNGHAIEVRVNAEDPLHGFQPDPATITSYREPGGFGTRVDSGVYAGFTISAVYDSLMAKVIVWGEDRESCRRRALRALKEYRVVGPVTTLSFSVAVLEHPVFAAGEATTSFLEDYGDELHVPADSRAGEHLEFSAPAVRGEPRLFDVEVDRRFYRVRVAELQNDARRSGPRRQSTSRTKRALSGTSLLSPLHGTVVAIRKKAGDEVSVGEPLFVIEAMKMENEIPAHRSGVLSAIHIQIGDTVETDQQLAVIQ
ncbi:MAG TPA: acetyl-CoA carboxylase biotin carboxylase subunit [Chloroflexota bacterium]